MLVVGMKKSMAAAIFAVVMFCAIAIGLVVASNTSTPRSSTAEIAITSAELRTTWCSSYFAVTSVNGPSQMRRAMDTAVAGLRVPLAELRATSWSSAVAPDADLLAAEAVRFRLASLSFAANPNTGTARVANSAFSRLRSDVNQVRSDVGLSPYTLVTWIEGCPH